MEVPDTTTTTATITSTTTSTFTTHTILQSLSSTVEELESKTTAHFDQLSAQIAALQTTNSEQAATISALQTAIADMALQSSVDALATQVVSPSSLRFPRTRARARALSFSLSFGISFYR